MHKPVLLSEVVSLAREVKPRQILDVTFGRGGHTRAFLEAFPETHVTALDQDLAAIEFGKQNFKQFIQDGRLTLLHASFHDLRAQSDVLKNPFDVILMDLGVSSPQLDDPERGFSFYHDGPLDMRMNQSRDLSAAEIVNSWSEVELIEVFTRYGEIRRPHRVVRAIVQDRKTNPFSTTRQLAGLIERVEGWRRKGHHPATTYFLALRLVVNAELSGLETSLPILMQSLTPGGRLTAISFHSLEDRIIKYAFKEGREWGMPLFKKVIVPSREECVDNPRARSAKLRVFQRETGADHVQTSLE